MAIRERLATGAAAAVLASLTVQFLLGMEVNLTVHVPHARFDVGSMMAVMRGQPVLMIHMMIGMLAALLALIAALTAASTRRAGAAVPAVAGLATILIAGYGGLRFLVSGGNAASFTMASGFIAAYAAYFIEMLALLRLRRSSPLHSAHASRRPEHLSQSGEQDPAAEILAQRYATGEISSEEYEERRGALAHARSQ